MTFKLSKIISAVVMLFLCTTVVIASETPNAVTKDEVIAIVENHYQNLVDLAAKVVQKNYLKSVNKTQVFEGALWIKKPGRLRLEYTNSQMILIDGKAALFYSRKNEQMIRKTFTDFEHMNIPVAFLLGAGAIRNDFDVAQPEPDKPLLLELLPKKPGAAMKKLRIQVEDSGRILGIMIFDKSGNTTEITFTETLEGRGVDDKVFIFKAPKGTEIIEQ